MAERGDGTSWQRRVARLAAGAALVTAIALSTPLRAVVTATAADGEARKPTKPPAGARWQCKDGTYSFVVSRNGACWGHRGVARALPSAARPVPAATPATTKKATPATAKKATPATAKKAKPAPAKKATPAPAKKVVKPAPKPPTSKPTAAKPAAKPAPTKATPKSAPKTSAKPAPKATSSKG